MLCTINSALSALRRNERGNVLILTAGGMFALLGMGGGALDISRVYLAKSRLQQACDAGVLAFRRSMQGTAVTSDTRETAKAFFFANFTPGKYGTENTSFSDPTVDSNVVVHGTARTTVPMTLMKIFDVRPKALSVTCDAQLQLPNTDVMFVLDTTGSMTDTNPGDSGSRISVLRQAVANFYAALENAKTPGTQVRYGFVPYSNTVNVGMLLKREWMVNKWAYQSRVFDHQEDVTGDNHTYTAWTPDNFTSSTSYGDPENCVAPTSTGTITNNPSSAWSPSDTALPRSRTNYRTVNGDFYSASVNGSGQCVITKKSYANVQQQRTENYDKGQIVTGKKNFYTYNRIEFDVTGYKGSASTGLMAGGTVNYPNVNDPASGTTTAQAAAHTWNASNACIEERDTLRPGETGLAWDMDVDYTPDANAATQWRPFVPVIEFARAVTNYNVATPTGWYMPSQLTSNGYVRLSSYPYNRAACPSAARKLQSKEAGLTAPVLQSYLDGLLTRGDTYHDIGFLWGLRLISKEGLFKGENTVASNGGDIARNIIFMTDGDTETHIHDYDAYGLSALDRRRSDVGSLPTDSQQNDIVEKRLLNYCSIAKNKKGITVWVIAFGTSLTSLLKECATTGKAYQANNASELNNTFAEIASKIAQLRLTR